MSGPEMSRLVALLADGLRVWVKRGEVELTEDQIYERARNQATAVLAEYMLIPHPDTEGVPVRRPSEGGYIGHGFGCPCGRCPGEFPAKPLGHSWSCKCDRCDLVKRSVKQ